MRQESSVKRCASSDERQASSVNKDYDSFIDSRRLTLDA
jgi:hypothetical protein